MFKEDWGAHTAYLYGVIAFGKTGGDTRKKNGNRFEKHFSEDMVTNKQSI